MLEYIILFGFLSLILYTILSSIRASLRRRPYKSKHRGLSRKELKQLRRGGMKL
jgi:hypothetical protein